MGSYKFGFFWLTRGKLTLLSVVPETDTIPKKEYFPLYIYLYKGIAGLPGCSDICNRKLTDY